MKNKGHYYTYKGVKYGNFKELCEGTNFSIRQCRNLLRHGVITKTLLGNEKTTNKI